MNKNLQKGVSLTIAGSVLLSSCIPHMEGTILDVPVTESNNPKRNSAPSDETASEVDDMQVIMDSCLIPISDSDARLIDITSKLLADIITEPSIADEFVSNPNEYLSNLGIDYDGDLDAGLIQMAIAASDPEIKEAIQNQDVNYFLDLCEQRGLLMLPTGLQYQGINDLVVNDMPIEQYLLENGYSQSLINSLQEDEDVAVAVEAVVAAYFVAIAAIAALVVAVVCPVALGEDYDKFHSLEISPLTLWLFNTNADYMYIPVEEWVCMQYEKIDLVLSSSPKYVEDEEFRNDLEKIIKANLIHTLL